MAISSDYLPGGAVQTTTDPVALPQLGAGANLGLQLPQIPQINPAYFDAINQQKYDAAQQAQSQKKRMFDLQLQAMQTGQQNSANDREDARLARVTGQEAAARDSGGPTWFEYQGAATRPVGLSPGMIPGMQADVTKLPPSMRPNQSSASYAPSAQYSQQLAADDESRFGGQINADRARSRNPSEVGGGDPFGPYGGSAVTPLNTRQPGVAAALSPSQRASQQGRAMYGQY